jgi:fatty acid/phospholipid biosynthesis enzyme
VVVIGHGGGSARAVRSSILQARKAVQGNVIAIIRERLEKLTPHAVIEEI